MCLWLSDCLPKLVCLPLSPPIGPLLSWLHSHWRDVAKQPSEARTTSLDIFQCLNAKHAVKKIGGKEKIFHDKGACMS